MPWPRLRRILWAIILLRSKEFTFMIITCINLIKGDSRCAQSAIKHRQRNTDFFAVNFSSLDRNLFNISKRFTAKSFKGLWRVPGRVSFMAFNIMLFASWAPGQQQQLPFDSPLYLDHKAYMKNYSQVGVKHFIFTSIPFTSTLFST